LPGGVAKLRHQQRSLAYQFLIDGRLEERHELGKDAEERELFEYAVSLTRAGPAFAAATSVSGVVEGNCEKTGRQADSITRPCRSCVPGFRTITPPGGVGIPSL